MSMGTPEKVTPVTFLKMQGDASSPTSAMDDTDEGEHHAKR